MNADIRAPQAPESYATFWEPVPNEPAPAAQNTSIDSAQAKDAYSEFVNVTEDTPASRHAERT